MPTVRGIFKHIETHYDSEFYGYINGDIIQSSFVYDILVDLLERKKRETIDPKVWIIEE